MSEPVERAGSGYGVPILKSAAMATPVSPHNCGIVNRRDNPAVAPDKAALRTSRCTVFSWVEAELTHTTCSLEAVGLNQIFNYRADEQVNHDPDVHKDLKKKESPDRIYGLRQTRNIENLLNDTVKRLHESEGGLDGTQVQELLGQPIQQSGDRQLFPFLVLEAKSGTSGSDWHSNQMQTAFVIRTFLATQNKLRAATGPHSRWQSGPLVWFFSNRGEDWRLCAAYVEQGLKRSHTVGTTDYVSVSPSPFGPLLEWNIC
jgi:hypothetical protein